MGRVTQEGERYEEKTKGVGRGLGNQGLNQNIDMKVYLFWEIIVLVEKQKRKVYYNL